ncbi:MAG: hypothetical protein KKA32_11535 [Actinobacteria bacterium]|nr:hypothetical protein [Actinomycetota bacterium]
MKMRPLVTAIVLAIVGAMAVWSFWANVLDPHPAGAPSAAAPSSAPPSSAPPAESSPLPPALAGLPLVAELSGEQGLASVEELHGKALGEGFDAAWVGEYESQGRATLWVSRSVREIDAEELLVRMTDRIMEGDSPFSRPVPIEMQGVPAYRLEGMGQVHYYFRSGGYLYWLGIDAPLSEAGLGELVAAAKVVK